ncbi:hypothetical protein GALMADRAFT_259904 [Galerina marginata CBS 339.88]|uniref:Uncharacterized protein n=1 Tax=Galerina marginata (strain CBS 339.88) TaxID=685588 RepID=A0A067S5C2_GALM3|nr:hypothetical protein GALMADRAFT_259904 [Galerina marginata CBS 339.88]
MEVSYSTEVERFYGPPLHLEHIFSTDLDSMLNLSYCLYGGDSREHSLGSTISNHTEVFPPANNLTCIFANEDVPGSQALQVGLTPPESGSRSGGPGSWGFFGSSSSVHTSPVTIGPPGFALVVVTPSGPIIVGHFISSIPETLHGFPPPITPGLVFGHGPPFSFPHPFFCAPLDPLPVSPSTNPIHANSWEASQKNEPAVPSQSGPGTVYTSQLISKNSGGSPLPKSKKVRGKKILLTKHEAAATARKRKYVAGTGGSKQRYVTSTGSSKRTMVKERWYYVDYKGNPVPDVEDK